MSRTRKFMPYPVAHMLFAAAVAEAILPRDVPHRTWKVVGCAALALTPDLDFAFVWFMHLGREWHRGFTHSILFALVAGVIGIALLGKTRWRECAAVALAVLSHAVLDFLTSVRSAGVELFWPFTSARFKLGWMSLPEPGHSESMSGFFMALLKISLVEAALFLPLLLIVWAVRRPSRKIRWVS